MDRITKDFLFAVIVTAFVITIPLTYNSGEAESSGLAMHQKITEEKETPHVEMVSPDKKTTTYKPVQTFNYRLKSVADPSDCSLLLNGYEYNTQKINPNTLGEFKVRLEPDYYTWKVECALLNGRTISSQEWSVQVKDPNELEKEFAGNQVTGNIAAEEDAPPEHTTDIKGVFIAMLAIGALIWMMNFRKNS